MTIQKELESEILRYYFVEKWRCGTIARQLRVHRDTVRRVLSQAGQVAHGRQRSSMIDPYLPFILETLAKYPKLTAARLHGMVRERGYTGTGSHFRHMVALHRPRKPAEAFLRLRTLPGELAQVDWAHAGTMQIGQARRPLMAFVMVLAYSRDIYLRFFLNAQMGSFLSGHIGAFERWGGVPKVLFYDNLKSAVLERQGDAIRFNKEMLAFAGHYRFEPRPVAVARGNEKGRAERAIRYIRDNFLAARQYTSLDDLNEQAWQWSQGAAADRLCPEDRTMTVREAFAREAPALMALPANPYPAEDRLEVRVGKTPYARFDGNDYSVSHTHVRQTVTVRASQHQVRIFDGAQMIASHRRSFDRSQQIEDPSHLQKLKDFKHRAHQHQGVNSLTSAVPLCQTLLERAAQRGYSIGGITTTLLGLLERYGAQALHIAVEDALAKGSPHPNTVRLALERRRAELGAAPPIAVTLPEHVRRKDAIVRPHRLDTYDQINPNQDNDDDSLAAQPQ